MIIDQHHQDGVTVNRELGQTHPVDIQAAGDLHIQQTIGIPVNIHVMDNNSRYPYCW